MPIYGAINNKCEVLRSEVISLYAFALPRLPLSSDSAWWESLIVMLRLSSLSP